MTLRDRCYAIVIEKCIYIKDILHTPFASIILTTSQFRFLRICLPKSHGIWILVTLILSTVNVKTKTFLSFQYSTVWDLTWLSMYWLSCIKEIYLLMAQTLLFFLHFYVIFLWEREVWVGGKKERREEQWGGREHLTSMRNIFCFVRFYTQCQSIELPFWFCQCSAVTSLKYVSHCLCVLARFRYGDSLNWFYRQLCWN